MHYTGPVVRPPHEANSVLLEITVGCTHNRCRFCTFYKDTLFQMAKLEQIETDLKEVKHFWPNAKRVYALGGDPFTMSTKHLKKIGRMIRKYLPKANIGTYARITSIIPKSVEELKELHDIGYNDLVIGIESGDDEVLKQMNKGYTSDDILRECLKLEQAGINYYVIYLGGLAGHGNGERNARNTAKILNQLEPSHMYMTSVAVLPNSELYQDVIDGKFEEATEKERIEETLILVKELKNPIILYGQSVANPVNFTAKLPNQKEELVRSLEQTLDTFTSQDEKNLREYRESLRTI
ncbi:MAG: radical SAM protein [Lachnospiraceae bacterium]